MSPGGGAQAQRHHQESVLSESGESLRHVGCYSTEGGGHVTKVPGDVTGVLGEGARHFGGYGLNQHTQKVYEGGGDFEDSGAGADLRCAPARGRRRPRGGGDNRGGREHRGWGILKTRMSRSP